MDKKKMKVLTIVGAAAVLSVVLLGLYGPRLAEALGSTRQRDDFQGTLFNKTVAIVGPKSNYKQYCGVKSESDPTVDCDNPEVYDNHLFEIQQTAVPCNGSECQITIKNKLTNRYCADEGNRIYCNRVEVGKWEKHGFIKHPELREFSLLGAKSGTDRKVCRDDYTGINCTSKTGQYNKEQRFRWVMDSELDRIRNADGTIRPKADAAAANQQTAAKLDAVLNPNNANVATSNVSTTAAVQPNSTTTPAPAAAITTMAVTTSNASTTTAATTTTSTPAIKEGAAIKCDDGTGMIYRYTQGQKRYYPHPDIASAWDPAWRQPQLLTAEQCRNIPTGAVMAKPGDNVQPNSATTPPPAAATAAAGSGTATQTNAAAGSGTVTQTNAAAGSGTATQAGTTSAPTLRDGSSIACTDSQGTRKVYFYTQGTKRYYPSAQIAAAWDPSWGNAQQLTADQCSGIPSGPDMVQPNSASTPSPATAAVASTTNTAAAATASPETATTNTAATATASSGTTTTQTAATAAGNAQEGIGVGVAVAGIVGVIALVSLMQMDK